MKKLYVIASMALLSAASLSAKELTFYQDSNKIENGSKFTFKDIEEPYEYTDRETGEMVVEYEYNPFIFLESDFTGSVTITATCLTGQSINLCAGGQCVSDVSVTKTGVMVSPNQKLNLLFDYVGTFPVGTEIPVVTAELTAVDETNPSVKASFTITMDGTQAGVSTVIANDNAFLPVEGGVEYSFNAPTQVAIYSLAGEAMIETSLNGNGTLSTANLPAGIYVYKAGAKSGKIYLR